MLGLGFKEFESAKRTISGIEVVRIDSSNFIEDLNYILSLDFWLSKI